MISSQCCSSNSGNSLDIKVTLCFGFNATHLWSGYYVPYLISVLLDYVRQTGLDLRSRLSFVAELMGTSVLRFKVTRRTTMVLNGVVCNWHGGPHWSHFASGRTKTFGICSTQIWGATWKFEQISVLRFPIENGRDVSCSTGLTHPNLGATEL